MNMTLARVSVLLFQPMQSMEPLKKAFVREDDPEIGPPSWPSYTPELQDYLPFGTSARNKQCFNIWGLKSGKKT